MGLWRLRCTRTRSSNRNDTGQKKRNSCVLLVEAKETLSLILDAFGLARCHQRSIDFYFPGRCCTHTHKKSNSPSRQKKSSSLFCFSMRWLQSQKGSKESLEHRGVNRIVLVSRMITRTQPLPNASREKGKDMSGMMDTANIKSATNWN